MDRRPPGLGPASEEPPAPRGAASPPARDLTESEWDRILPPIDESDPAFKARLKAAVEESLADPRPSISGDDVLARIRQRHEARLKRGL